MLRKPVNYIKGLSRRRKLALVIVLVLFLAFNFLRRGSAKVVPETVAVTRGDIQEVISVSGVVSGKNSANLTFATSGKLVSLPVVVGDRVTKGQVIAKLDGITQGVAYQQALNNLRDKEAAVQNILDQVKDHDADESFAQKAARTAAEVARDNAYDTVRATRRALQDTIIYSPISGVVSKQDNINVGENVSVGELAASVVDLSEKVFEAEVDESDISKVSVGDNAVITLNTYPDKEFAGHVLEIAPTTKTASSGATVVVVKISLFDPVIKDIAGLNGQASIIISEKKDVVVLPQLALIGDNEVYVMKDGEPVLTKVEIGLESDTQFEAVSGIEPGDAVVINPEVLVAK